MAASATAEDSKFTPEDSRFTPAVIAKVANIIADAERSGERVAAWDAIKSVLLESTLGWIAQLPAPHCGVHPDNRSTQGVGGSEAHCHGRDILKAGFSWQRAADAVAVEMPPSGPRKDAAIRFNESLVRLSGGLIPPLEVLRVLSISGSHTNTFIRAVVAGCETDVEDLASDGGRLSEDMLCVGRPAFKQACESGLRWFVPQHECEVVWPGLIPLVEKALNTQAREDQSEIEIMLAIHKAHAKAINSGSSPNWHQIEKDASCSLPPCAAWVGTLADFVRLNSGGVQGELLNDLNTFSRSFRCTQKGSKRMLGSEFFRKLASLSWGVEKYPYVLNACIKSNLTSPANKVTDGFCKLVAPSNLSTLMSKGSKDLVVQAENMMTDARKIVGALKIEQAKAVTLLGQLDVRLVNHIMRLGKASEGVAFSTLGEISQVLTCNMSHMHALMMLIPHSPCMRIPQRLTCCMLVSTQATI